MQAKNKIIAPVIMLSINNRTIISAHLSCCSLSPRTADTSMNFQEVHNLFGYCWFEHQIFGSKSISSQPLDSNEEPQQLTNNLSSPSFVIRSFSDQNLSSMDSSNSENTNISPSSVLQMPKLQTVQSGKEFNEIGYNGEEGEVANKSTQKELDSKRKRRRRKQSSKSLSELEIEELKGFMDLGFEFKDEDKDSNLVLIVPGLQRLGKKEDEEGKIEKEIVEEGSRVSRPYLSEAWDAFEKKKNNNNIVGRKNQQLLMNWKLPATGDEMELKNHLKFWAQTIASNVR